MEAATQEQFALKEKLPKKSLHRESDKIQTVESQYQDKDNVTFFAEAHNATFYVLRPDAVSEFQREVLIEFTNNIFTTSDPTLIRDIRNSAYYKTALWEGDFPSHIKEKMRKRRVRRYADGEALDIEEAEFIDE